MDSLQTLLEGLHNPWKAKIRSILWDENILDADFVWPEFFDSTAFTVDVCQSKIRCELAFFEPGQGPKLFDPAVECEIELPVNCGGFAANTWIGFNHATVIGTDPLKVEIGEKAAIWNIAYAERSLPLTIGHLCAGGFAGWDRAFTWLVNDHVIGCQQSFAVESDHNVMATWSKTTGATIFQGPFSPQVPVDGKCFGIVTPIQDVTWFNACRQQANVIFTASPPCQTWSCGGKQFGLEAENGMTFMQVIYSVKWVRPIATLVECSDAVPRHAHYVIIQKAFRLIGYLQCWSQVVPLHDFTGMRRSRWLSLFVRGDVQIFDAVGSFNLADPFHKKWNDHAYDFFLPNEVEVQLQLSEELKHIYGNPQLFPNARIVNGGQIPQVDEILKSRCIRSCDFLPTLCASYASQHEIEWRHLIKKGIFAALDFKNGIYRFIDPARFAAMLGVTTDQGIVFPKDIRDAFHQLGNSISVIHSVLSVSIALSVLGFSKRPIMQNVIKCWENRIFAHKTITLCDSEFIHLVPCELAEDVIYRSIKPDSTNDTLNGIQIRDKKFSFDLLDSIRSLIHHLDIHSIEQQGIFVISNDVQIDPDHKIRQYEGCSIKCLKGEVCLFELNIGFSPVEPTFPWTPHQQDEIVDFDQDIDPKTLQEAVIRAECMHQNTDEHPTEKIAVFSTNASAGTQFVSLQLPAYLDYNQTSHWIANELGMKNCDIVWYETEHFRQPSHQRCLIATERNTKQDDFRLVIVHIQGQLPSLSKLPSPISPDQIPGSEFANKVLHNGHEVGMQTLVSVQHGDDFCFQDGLKRRRFVEQSPSYGLQKRIEIMREEGHKLGTDEFAIIQRFVNNTQKPIECADVWDFASGFPCDLPDRIQKFSQNNKPNVCLVCPVLCDDHWAAFELTKCPSGIRITFCNFSETLLQHIQNELICRCSEILKHFCWHTVVIPAIHGFCGWALLFRWFRRFELTIPPSTDCPSEIFAAVHNSIDGQHHWGNVSSFALHARLFCFQNFVISRKGGEKIRFGATGNEPNAPDATMAESGGVKPIDPWLKYDPWQKGQKQCKWEDLTLPKDHPIHDKQRKRLQQIHRLQLNQNVGGVAFCTKANVNDILAKKPKSPFALILPANDRLHFDESLKLKTLPSCEIIVEDGATGAVYKRQIVIAYQEDDIIFELPKPSYKGTLTEKSEIVLEVHSTLVSRDSFAAFRDKPHDTLKIKVVEQFPSKATEHFNIYGIRKIPEPNDPEKFKVQAMCKIDSSLRPSFLEASGAGDIIARDFIPKGEQINDVTVVPRFWAVDRNGKADALRSAGSTEGFAGIIATKRGLAVRAWSAKVAQLRTVLMSQDERITKENINIVPTIVYDSTGWPSSASPNEIVNAVGHSCGTPPIPSRCFRALGVVTWTLGFATEPKVTKFSVSFNGITYEILMTKPSEKNKTTKGVKSFAKGSSKGAKGSKEIVQQLPEEANDRLTNLETKFAAMERRQDSLETKLQHGFEGVQDQLRQVLNAVQPRASSPSRTGFTPPSKVPKSS